MSLDLGGTGDIGGITLLQVIGYTIGVGLTGATLLILSRCGAEGISMGILGVGAITGIQEEKEKRE